MPVTNWAPTISRSRRKPLKSVDCTSLWPRPFGSNAAANWDLKVVHYGFIQPFSSLTQASFQVRCRQKGSSRIRIKSKQRVRIKLHPHKPVTKLVVISVGKVGDKE